MLGADGEAAGVSVHYAVEEYVQKQPCPGKSSSNKCIATNNKKLLGAPGIATRSKDATRGSWPYYKKLLGAPGIATRSKDATRDSWPYY